MTPHGKKIYHREAHQILEVMQQKALQCLLPAGRYATPHNYISYKEAI